MAATDEELHNLTLKPVQELEPIEDITSLEGFALMGFNTNNGAGIAIDANELSKLAKKSVVGTEEEIEQMTKQPGVFYCSYED